MQVVYPTNGTDASTISVTAQKRLLRVVEGQTQATPYAGYLDSSLRAADGSIRVPKSTDTTPVTRSADAFTYLNSIVPGTVMVKTTGESFSVAGGANEALVPFGLLAQWVGGTFDNVKSSNEIAVWYGPGAVFDILAPGWNDTEVATAISSATAGKPVKLYAGTDGRLAYFATPANRLPVCDVIDRPSAAYIRVKLLV